MLRRWWFFGDGASRFLPQQWSRFVDQLPIASGPDLVGRLNQLMVAGTDSERQTIANAWEAWSTAVVMFSLDGTGNTSSAGGASASAVAKTSIELHYGANRYFLKPGQLVDRLKHVPRVPIRIVHGRRDLTCTAESAWLLHKALPDSELEILPTAGHLSSEKPMVDALIRAAESIADELK